MNSGSAGVCRRLFASLIPVVLIASALSAIFLPASASAKTSSDPIVGQWDVTYGAPATVRMTLSGGVYTEIAESPVEVTGSSCYLPPGTVVATFTKTGPGLYAGQHGLWYVNNCSFASWTGMTLTLGADGNTLSASLADGESAFFTKVSGDLTVDAGRGQTVYGTHSISLDGSVSDPDATTSWSQVSGPGTATFASGSPQSKVKVTAPGSYVFELTATDNGEYVSDDVTIEVVDRFRFETQAWIPQSSVVDPVHPDPANLRVNTPDSYSACGIITGPLVQSSTFTGDGHVGYAGGFRAQEWVEFDWDGTSISHLIESSPDDVGTTHRPFVITTTANGRTRTCTTWGRASSSGKVTQTDSQQVVLTIRSSNPLVFLAPPIQSQLTVTMTPQSDVAQISHQTTYFPSHGFQVTFNGQVVNTTVDNNASCDTVLGDAGWVDIGLGLTDYGNYYQTSVDPNSGQSSVILPC